MWPVRHALVGYGASIDIREKFEQVFLECQQNKRIATIPNGQRHVLRQYILFEGVKGWESRLCRHLGSAFSFHNDRQPL
jgi:hypothetical protein